MAEKAKPTKGAPTMPSVVYAEASVRSVGGVSLFETPGLVTSETVPNFYSESQLVNSAVERLRTEGFEVLQVGQATITIAAPAGVYERVFKTKIVAEEREAIKEFGQVTTATFLECPDTAIPGLISLVKSPLADVLEGVALNEPVYYFAPSAFPVPKAYWNLEVPSDVALGMNASRAHRAGFTGRGLKVVMVDSGWYRHPFFVQRGYHANSVVLGPAATNPDHDEHGHGTGESANVFAVAPDVDFTMVKINFVNSVGAFNAAVALHPDIISCSWGSSKKNPPLSAADQALAAAVAYAVKQGIIVIFSAGNGHWGFPGQHPDVISAGGVYMHPDGSFEATPYASGFASNIYPGRNVPDVCGLVGLPSGDPVPGRSPGAMYIMLPVEPNDYLDKKLHNNGANHYRSPGATPPYGDETANNDGWAAFSGTSAAAPQLAGICALMKQACRRLTLAQARDILKRTARDVTAGNCHPNTGGHPAVPGPDLATGNGLADAFYTIVMSMKGNLEVVAREGDRLVDYWRVDQAPWTWHGPFEIAKGVAGNPVFLQSCFGQRGNFELVVPIAKGGLAHFWRDNDAAGMPWHGPTPFGSGRVEAVSLIQSNFGTKGNLEVVAREGDRLVDYWRVDQAPWTWHGPFEIAKGVAGNPVFLQSCFGQRGNFELVVPIAKGGLAHFWRDNDAAGMPWHGPTPFGNGRVEAVSLIQSNFGTRYSL